MVFKWWNTPLNTGPHLCAICMNLSLRILWFCDLLKCEGSRNLPDPWLTKVVATPFALPLPVLPILCTVIKKKLVQCCHSMPIHRRSKHEMLTSIKYNLHLLRFDFESNIQRWILFIYSWFSTILQFYTTKINQTIWQFRPLKALSRRKWYRKTKSYCGCLVGLGIKN